ncbi:MAG: VWA domain-containing protein [Endomicrobia bacterium]|nr:VWA domain-containing protein [Endomicrobiia bacterium]MCL2506269.1 VWA domain-containing protein [Endomicrobiia bacterium]
MRFANPIFLAIFLPLLVLAYLYINVFRKKSFSSFARFPKSFILKSSPKGHKAFLYSILKYLKYFALVLIIIALARPQEGKTFAQSQDMGIDIMIALDVSGSMSSIDFKPLDRMQTAKKVTEDFIRMRKYDRIGLVLFAGLSFTQSPLTTDKDSLIEFVRNVNIGDTGVDGTAIGSAIMTSVNRLKDSEAKSRIIVLITDGVNNMGEIDPITASKIAASHGIKIYTIGVGSPEGAVYIVNDPFFGKREVKNPNDRVDENTLREIALNTGGEYFAATDTKTFENVMRQIDSLEKHEIKTTQFTHYNELYKYFVLAAFLILLLVVFLENTYLRKLP